MKINWGHIAPHPALSIHLGDIGSGKTATACGQLDYYRTKTKIKCNLVSPKIVHKEYVKTAKWIGRVDPNSLRVPKNSANLIDDIHLMYSARKWYKDINSAIDNLARESRHKRCSFIYTTQQTTVVDTNIIQMVSCIVIKRPSIMQKQSDRPFVRRIMKDADRAFKELKLENYNDHKKYAYVISRHLPEPFMLENIKLPKWWSENISTAYRNVDFSVKKPFKINSLFKDIDLITI